MEPGERDRIVTIQQLTDASGATGFPYEQWTPLADLYASRADDRGFERFRSAQVSATELTRWEIGYRADCDPELVDVPKRRRVVYQSRIFDILAATLIGSREGIELTTQAKVGVLA